MKNVFYFIFLIFIICSSGNLLAQSNSVIVADSSFEHLSRFRLSVGFVNLFAKDNKFSFRHPFVNLSYRTSGFDRTSSDFKIKFVFEPGINGLIIADKRSNKILDYSFYFLPYAKFGPDIRLGKNLFIAGSLGLAIASYKSNFAPLPFFGVNGFYLYDLNKKFSLEVETGFHTTYSPKNLPLLFYFTIGIALF